LNQTHKMKVSIYQVTFSNTLCLLLLVLLGQSVFGQQAPQWTIKGKNFPSTIDATDYLIVDLDAESMKSNMKQDQPMVWLPDVNGKFTQYRLTPSTVVSPSVAKHYTIQTFRGISTEDPTIRIACDFSIQGFRAAVFEASNTYFIEPQSGSKTEHLVYTRQSLKTGSLGCQVDHQVEQANGTIAKSSQLPDQKLSLNLALAAAGEFSQQVSGGATVNPTTVLNALASGVNIANEIFLRDLGIEFELVSTPALVFADPLTDPFDPTMPSTLLQSCQATIENNIPVSDYNLGQVIFWGNFDGSSVVSSLCIDSRKGAAYSSSNISQSHLWIDVMSHQLGHQLGARHTHSASECSSSVTTGQLYEPGAGSSIMAYAGRCGAPAEYQTTPDPYFHFASISEIYERAILGTSGNICGQLDPTGNIADPVVDAGANLTIPTSTPFLLVGEAMDPVDQALTYDWEQYDGTGSMTIGSPACAADQALIRYRPPVAVPFRSFPQQAEVLLGNNNGVAWEQLPCSPRTMNFSLAVRDNNPNWGRIGEDRITVTVVNSGPFQMTIPNGGESLNGGQVTTINWDENGTNSHCPAIDILLSSDGGVTYTVIADGVINSGIATVVLPNIATTTARILISCDAPAGFGSASVFYDITDADFTIIQSSLVDTDMDGFDVSVDCDDNDPLVFPGATEICNGIDDNCSGLIDDNDPAITGQMTYYEDVDGDGYGDPASSLVSCNAPSGYVIDNTDCDDTNANINTGATETCNGIDDDCDGLIDDNDPSLAGTSLWFEDADGDAYGDANNSIMTCNPPAGYVSNNTDCNDSDPQVNPLATEICNGIDDDCDGLTDSADPSLVGTATWFEDNDGDGFGNPSSSLSSCTTPPGYVSNGSDCNDNNSNINPNAQEICNGVDDDCDGLIDANDPSVAGTATWYADNDGDGFGNPAIPTTSCSAPQGFVQDNTDCDDNFSSINPGATEICNGVDDDCDGLIDGADPDLNGTGLWYADVDGDGYGSQTNFVIDCMPPPGYVATGNDCDDNNFNVNPGAPEICNGIDDDCDGFVDDADPSLSGTAIYYLDADLDGAGDPAIFIQSCNPVIGYVSNNSDCNDNDQNISPFAQEICNGVDDDCDGLIDDADPNLSGGSSIWYVDADMDGSGNPNITLLACSQPTGYVNTGNDCNDNDPTVGEFAQEVCNGVDDDCDGLVDAADPDVQGGSIWYQDADNDGFGSAASTLTSCNQPAGYVPNSLDCNDGDANINPAATEICDNNVDDDCDGLIDTADPDAQSSTWFQDFDNDGYGSSAATIQACTQPAGYVPNDQDCNDAAANINPAATESCNGLDDDCDGLIDDNDPSLQGTSVWYIDFDGDSYGSPNGVINACFQPTGYSSNNLDCNDNNFNINPGAGEICDNNIDDDCDGLIDAADPDVAGGSSTWYQDVDGDGFGNAAAVLTGCNQPNGYVGNNLDCNDNNFNINPGALEICDNGIDDDCDGFIDTADPDLSNVALTWYFDMDGDGFGGTQNSLVSCTQPAGYVLNNSDCNDGDSGISPNAVEICDNGIDEDCDGLVDAADPDVSDGIWYLDGDGDGFGNLVNVLTSCVQPPGYVSNGIDCDDSNDLINPNALELCDNGIDDDCDGLVDGADPDVTGSVFWYEDLDGDGYGNSQVFSLSCMPPTGYVADNTDCNDGLSSVNPDALELCDNGIDDDCDGLIDGNDPDVAAVGTWYQDADNDGFGDADNAIQTCNPSSGYVQDNTDCDDSNAAINPDGIEVCNGLDDNCNGFIDIDDPELSGVGIWFADEDEDGYGDPDNFIFECTQLPGYLANREDCDDTNPDINPDAQEICNGIDDNCDGLTDLDDPSIVDGLTTWYLDTDGDGYGDPDNALDDCNQPIGFVDNDLDCDDLDADINPDAVEINGNSVDENCDGELTAVISLAESDIEVFPNPVIQKLYITGGEGQVMEIRITDIHGRMMLSKTLYLWPSQIDVTSLDSGTYFITLYDRRADITIVDRFVKLN